MKCSVYMSSRLGHYNNIEDLRFKTTPRPLTCSSGVERMLGMWIKKDFQCGIVLCIAWWSGRVWLYKSQLGSLVARMIADLPLVTMAMPSWRGSLMYRHNMSVTILFHMYMQGVLCKMVESQAWAWIVILPRLFSFQDVDENRVKFSIWANRTLDWDVSSSSGESWI